MSNTFQTLGANRPIRVLGAVVGLAPGGGSLLIGSSGSLDPGFRAAALILGVTLGWIFAPKAGSPGWRNGLQAVTGITLLGVVLGSFLVVALSIDYGTTDPSGWLPTVLAAGLVGLVLLGIPLMILTFAVATAWVGVVKAGVHLGLVDLAPVSTIVVQ